MLPEQIGPYDGGVCAQGRGGKGNVQVGAALVYLAGQVLAQVAIVEANTAAHADRLDPADAGQVDNADGQMVGYIIPEEIVVNAGGRSTVTFLNLLRPTDRL